MRKKRFIYNTGAAIMNHAVVIICGMILPALIIRKYGSATSGLISSISQFLAFFSLMEMGVGAVVRAALYKPLSQKDDESVSRVLIASKRFFSRIGLLLCVYTVALMVYFPAAVDHSHGYLNTAILVASISLSSISNYLFGIIYSQLLNADQKSYIQLSITALTTVLSTAVSVVMIHLGASIESVKIAAAIAVLLRPLLLRIYVHRHYSLNLSLSYRGDVLLQKWNGFSQHVSLYIVRHADTIILTVFSTLENVSIYYVYHLVVEGLVQMMTLLTSGLSSLFGDMYAREEYETLRRTFRSFEWMIHTLVTLIFSLAAVLIIPFVQVYTKGVHDANYIVPAFAYLIVTAEAVYCLRLPYNIIVQAAGHFKQTQNSAIIEAVINVFISIALVKKFGLAGVAIGTFAAMLYRTIYLAWYLKKAIVFVPLRVFSAQVLLDIVTAGAIVLSSSILPTFSKTWGGWLLYAFLNGALAVLVTVVINLLFRREDLKAVLSIVRKKL